MDRFQYRYATIRYWYNDICAGTYKEEEILKPVEDPLMNQVITPSMWGKNTSGL